MIEGEYWGVYFDIPYESYTLYAICETEEAANAKADKLNGERMVLRGSLYENYQVEKIELVSSVEEEGVYLVL